MPTNRPPETPLAVGALVAMYRIPLAVLCLLLVLVGCGACGLLAYSLRIQPEYAVYWRSFSAGVIVNECNLQFGYYDELSKINNSIEWKVC